MERGGEESKQTNSIKPNERSGKEDRRDRREVRGRGDEEQNERMQDKEQNGRKETETQI